MKNTISEQIFSPKNTSSSFGGAMIIAGTAVGAGMLSLPIVTAGMWYLWALPAILLVWLCMYLSGLFILESNLHYPLGAHLGAIAKDCLHPVMTFINNLSLLFVLYILTYAYITIGSPFLKDALLFMGLSLPNKVTALLYVSVFGAIVVYSTKTVDRITSVILIAMMITFALSLPSLLLGVRMPNLLNYIQKSPTYSPYIYSGLASIVAAFGFHGNVSSLVKYYKKDHRKVKRSLFYGTVIAMIIYILWITGAHGNLSRAFFQENILSSKDQATQLIKQLNVANYLVFFSNLAILSSFLGVTLGLFDFIADACKLRDNAAGRIKTGMITFMPPLVLALLFPYGFIVAIGFAGLMATIWALIMPALMVIATRKKYSHHRYQVSGGVFTPYFIILFGLGIALCEILALLKVVPTYQ